VYVQQRLDIDSAAPKHVMPEFKFVPLTSSSTNRNSQYDSIASSGTDRASSSGMQLIEEKVSYLITVTCAVERETGGYITRSKFIEYGISITRLPDGSNHIVYKRFRDIKTLYYDVSLFFFFLSKQKLKIFLGI
jgi:hypothetical protein